MEKCPPNDGKRYAFTRAIDLLLADKQEVRKGAAHMARLQIPPSTLGCASRGADSPRSPLRQLAGPHANRSNILERKAQESCPTNHKQSFFSPSELSAEVHHEIRLPPSADIVGHAMEMSL